MQLANTPPLQSTTPGLHPVSFHQMAPPVRGNTHPITAYYSVYRPRKDERLSRRGRLVTYRNKVPPPGVKPRHVTHPSTNRARCRVTSLIRRTPLPLRHAANHDGCKLVLLRFQTFCCRSVSVGFAKKNRGFRFGFGFCLSRFPPVVNVVRLCGPLHIKPAAVRYIFLCITPVDRSKYPTAWDWWRKNHHLYPTSHVLQNATCLAVCTTDIRC